MKLSRTWIVIGGCAFLAIAAVGRSSYALQTEKPAAPPSEIRAQSFVVVDDKDKEHGYFGFDAGSKKTMFTLSDANGAERVLIWYDPEKDEAAIFLGAGGGHVTRLELSDSPKTGTKLVVGSIKDGIKRAFQLHVPMTGNSSWTFVGPDKQGMTLMPMLLSDVAKPDAAAPDAKVEQPGK